MSRSGEFAQLYAGLYEDIKRIAHVRLAQVGGVAQLNTTALAHEGFLKLAERESSEFQTEEHFFATAATVLRSVLVDHARRRISKKRGAGRRGSQLESFSVADPSANVSGLLELEDAMQSLAKADPRSARVAELRIFGAMPMDHVARLLGISVPTAERDWRFARAFLEKQYGVGRAGAAVESNAGAGE